MSSLIASVSWTAKGSFGPTFSGQEAEEMADTPDARASRSEGGGLRSVSASVPGRHRSRLVELSAVHVDSTMTYTSATIYSPVDARLPTGLKKEKRYGE
jgi:hypothetical protein